MEVNVLLFDKFETLDAFGPVEILSQIKDFKINYISKNGAVVHIYQGFKVITEDVKSIDKNGILVIPGGIGVRDLVNDTDFLNMLKHLAEESHFCLSICTGSALLAKCGVLNNIKATSNKKALEWVKQANENVIWIDKARWVVDGKFYTSSGVSAGMDMALGFVSDQFGKDKAYEISEFIEYIWNEDKSKDIFYTFGN
ncbi:dimethyladenosine transferase [Paraclostridium bifermentans]|uniref:DJ-1/PfpI family protein n=1 Tax=Paraclostridium bifermentans TaxID=1490 RepID=UPI00280EA2BF|nr:dimethyladenosine transferase [Paraclostridium bifermentans]GKZ05982.1 dimethyladenosine transferase [Paraclostridium bifermentans]GKZ10736.1 dimethyladenosine transferase [Paraclostridium bifermentans]